MKKFFQILKLIIFLVIMMWSIGCSQKTTFVKIDPKYQVKSSHLKQLERRYKEYWNSFSQKRFKKSYYYELPHQRFIYSLQWYQDFNKPNDQNYTIILKSIKLKNDYEAHIKSQYVSSDNKTSSNFIDKWYFVNGKWYHLMKTSRFDLAKTLE